MKKAEYSFSELTDIMNFGLYKGKQIGDVMREDPQYIDWCLNKFKGFKLYKKLAEQYRELKQNAT